MEKRLLRYENGVYSADIDITVEEWKKMLIDKTIFTESALQMIQYWYEQNDYQATNKEIITRYNIDLEGTPFNGIVIGLGKRIIKYLNRFEVIAADGSKSFFILPFEGWHEDYNKNKNFVWKLRDELIIAIEELNLFSAVAVADYDELENYNIIENTSEGKRKVKYVTKYERNIKNRRLAIQIHGTKCCVCEFDFEKMYGERGKGFIEVHHIKPLYENDDEVVINPKEDLICVCSNCHRMFHRRKDKVPSPNELREIIKGKYAES